MVVPATQQVEVGSWSKQNETPAFGLKVCLRFTNILESIALNKSSQCLGLSEVTREIHGKEFSKIPLSYAFCVNNDKIIAIN
jgi:hypothetical protein